MAPTEKPSDIASEIQSELYIQRIDMVLTTYMSKHEVDASPWLFLSVLVLTFHFLITEYN
jgi:hypothetical protein